MQIATWNVNSVRTRLSHVVQWLQENTAVDVLCLQETKVVDADFPYAAFLDLGYYAYVYGQKSYNGVAMISRQPLTDVSMGFASVLGELTEDLADLDIQKRLIAATLDTVRIVNLYVPNGSSIASEKYDYKLRWLKALQAYLEVVIGQEIVPQIVICGDFNVAIEDIDIHDATDRANQVMATDAERNSLTSVLSLGFKDAFRKFTTAPGHFSWWDYRAGSFHRNHGWRIDYHFLTAALYEQAIACNIDIAPRHLTQPSDHVPVIVEF